MRSPTPIASAPPEPPSPITVQMIGVRNLMEMAGLRTPIICTVIGEGGSGGALAIGVGDRTLMLEYSTYSVITPEGCASILWRSADKAKDAAEQLGMTAKRLKELGLVDKVIREPIGGAHRNPMQMAKRLKAVLMNELDALEPLSVYALLERRSRAGAGSASRATRTSAGPRAKPVLPATPPSPSPPSA